MAPRRGGNGGAGAEVAAAGGRNYFEPPPLKRMQPWKNDGSGSCDIIAGGVDADGFFKGIYVSGVHLMALMRTFQLSKVFMPCDVPTPIAALGQNLNDGIPLIIVTRGCFGRELDIGPGPTRNDVQKTIWQTARDMRAEMPQILITTIDIPNDLGADQLQACLEAPLNEYRELMYQDGTWYTPTVVNAAPVGRWLNENVRQAKSTVKNGKTMNSQFNRKKFDWQDAARHYTNMWAVGWRSVLEARPATQVARRTDLKFTPDAPKPEPQPIKPAAPSNAEVAFKKALAAAKESGDKAGILSAVTKYMEKASMKETETIQEAISACEEVGTFEGTTAKFKILITMSRFEEAMDLATQAKASAESPEVELEALKLLVGCHQSLGDLEKAVEVAATGKAEVSRKGDEAATGKAYVALVDAHLAKGDIDEAIAAAKEGTTQKGKVEAFGYAALATAQMAKSSAAEAPVEVKDAAREAAEAATKAAELFKALSSTKDQADALKVASTARCAASEFVEATVPATELQSFGDSAEGLCWKAAGLGLVVSAHLKCNEVTRSYLEGGAEAMESAARSAVAISNETSDAATKAASLKILAEALAAIDPASGEAEKSARKAAAAFKALGDGDAMYEALLISAKVSMTKGTLPTAYWDAKQVVAQAAPGSKSYDEALSIVNNVARAAAEAGKPVNAGAPVPVVMGGGVQLV